jgi:hypothetical protein
MARSAGAHRYKHFIGSVVLQIGFVWPKSTPVDNGQPTGVRSAGARSLIAEDLFESVVLEIGFVWPKSTPVGNGN